MNKFLFSCSTDHGDYGFYASWNNDVVDYEIEDDLFEKKNYGYFYPVLKPFSLDYIGPLKPVLKGALDKETSQKFIELIEKAKIYEMDEKIKKQQEAFEGVFACTDRPTYKIAYMNNKWIDSACWYSGDNGSIVEEQKYLFMALMLCDSDAFDFLLWNIGDQYNFGGPEVDVHPACWNRPFFGEIKSFYFSSDGVIQQIEGNQNQCSYENIDELKSRMKNLFTDGNPIKDEEVEGADLEVILINEKDEVFYYCGDNGKNYEFDELAKYASEFVRPIVTK